MRGSICEFERGREHLVQQKEHFDWVPYIQKEIVLLIESSLKLQFENGNQSASLDIIEILSKVSQQINQELSRFKGVLKFSEKSGMESQKCRVGRRCITQKKVEEVKSKEVGMEDQSK